MAGTVYNTTQDLGSNVSGNVSSAPSVHKIVVQAMNDEDAMVSVFNRFLDDYMSPPKFRVTDRAGSRDALIWFGLSDSEGLPGILNWRRYSMGFLCSMIMHQQISLTVAEIASDFGVSTQAIYKNKDYFDNVNRSFGPVFLRFSCASSQIDQKTVDRAIITLAVEGSVPISSIQTIIRELYGTGYNDSTGLTAN